MLKTNAHLPCFKHRKFFYFSQLSNELTGGARLIGIPHFLLEKLLIKRIGNRVKKINIGQQPVDMNTRESCGGAVKVVACIDDPVVINKILTHLHVSQNNQVMLPVSRAPPAAGFT